MIAHLTGKAIAISDKSITVLTSGGVGYEVFPAGSLLAMVQKDGDFAAEILTVVRENEISLYGFGDRDEKVLFQKLLSVSGIGPKMALAMVSVPPQHFMKAVDEGDVAFLTKIPGLGKKKAERLIIELRGKIDLSAESGTGNVQNPAFIEAAEALEGLGYDQVTIKKALEKAPENLSAEDLVKYFLSSGN